MAQIPNLKRHLEGVGPTGCYSVDAPSIHAGLSWINISLHRHSDVAIVAEELCGKRGGRERRSCIYRPARVGWGSRDVVVVFGGDGNACVGGLCQFAGWCVGTTTYLASRSIWHETVPPHFLTPWSLQTHVINSHSRVLGVFVFDGVEIQTVHARRNRHAL